MASTFPNAIDSFTDPLSGSPLNSPSHSAQHADLNDAVEKIETYMGLVKVVPTSATNGTVGATGTVTVGNAVSSVTVSGCFSALYNNYKIMFANGAASAACDLAIQLSGITTAYFGGIMHVSSAPGGVTVAGVNNAASWTYSGMMRGSTAGGFMDLDLYGPFLTTTRTRVRAPFVRSDDQSFGTFTGIVENTASASGFVLSTNGGATITGGQITVYGYRI
jgi:hypothetical protein